MERIQGRDEFRGTEGRSAPIVRLRAVVTHEDAAVAAITIEHVVVAGRDVGLLLMSVCDQNPVIETVGVAL